MAITNFIPEIWNAQMLVDFRAQAVAAALVNRDYEGDAQSGNTVNITSAVDVAIKDYAGNSRTTSADAVDDAGQQLLIDQEKNFDFYVDDIDRRQAAGSMDAYTRSAGEGLSEDADQFILSTAVTGATTSDTAAPLTTGDDAFDLLNDLRKALNQLHVPRANRVAIVNAEFEHLLTGSDSKFTDVDRSGDGEGLRNASIGRALGFEVIGSENLPDTVRQQVLAFYTPSVSFVSQINETEAMRADDKFADRLRGLHVYGAKVTRADGVATWVDNSA